MPPDTTARDQKADQPSGRLYVVATPIGNREDITLRALRTLQEVDLVAAEDTRHTGRFLAYHGINNKLISYHEHNERERTPQLVEQLKQGASIALVSNAGTPSVSDPGYRLVYRAVAQGIAVIPIPGVSAAITALCVAGLPTDTFVFTGFLPRKKNRRTALLEKLAGEERTLVFYESPHRIVALLDEVHKIMGDRDVVLAREMTKLHEEYQRGPISTVMEVLNNRQAVKGECTLLVTGHPGPGQPNMEQTRAALQRGLRDSQQPLAVLTKAIAKRYGLSKKEVYQEALQLKKAKRDTSDA
jgi:16S rRNA (cytidine1402-2'-O)-methyltransferase